MQAAQLIGISHWLRRSGRRAATSGMRGCSRDSIWSAAQLRNLAKKRKALGYEEQAPLSALEIAAFPGSPALYRTLEAPRVANSQLRSSTRYY